MTKGEFFNWLRKTVTNQYCSNYQNEFDFYICIPRELNECGDSGDYVDENCDVIFLEDIFGRIEEIGNYFGFGVESYPVVRNKRLIHIGFKQLTK